MENEGEHCSTCVIHVPLERYTPVKKELAEEQRVRDLSGKHLLIADDNNLNLVILRAILSPAGITFMEARDGEEAVKLFVDSPEHTFDCILMDMRMPKLDGIRATAEIRASGKADATVIPIIGVSANGFEYDIRQARMAGVDDYIAKPIDRELLFSSIDRLIKRAKQK